MPRGIEAARQRDSREANFNELRKTIATKVPRLTRWLGSRSRRWKVVQCIVRYSKDIAEAIWHLDKSSPYQFFGRTDSDELVHTEAETETAARNSIQTLYKNGDGIEENRGVVFFSSVSVLQFLYGISCFRLHR